MPHQQRGQHAPGPAEAPGPSPRQTFSGGHSSSRHHTSDRPEIDSTPPTRPTSCAYSSTRRPTQFAHQPPRPPSLLQHDAPPCHQAVTGATTALLPPPPLFRPGLLRRALLGRSPVLLRRSQGLSAQLVPLPQRPLYLQLSRRHPRRLRGGATDSTGELESLGQPEDSGARAVRTKNNADPGVSDANSSRRLSTKTLSLQAPRPGPTRGRAVTGTNELGASSSAGRRRVQPSRGHLGLLTLGTNASRLESPRESPWPLGSARSPRHPPNLPCCKDGSLPTAMRCRSIAVLSRIVPFPK